MSARPTQPAWHDMYQAAISEPDRHKIHGRVERARRDLVERLRQLDPQCPDERWELDRALNALRMLALLATTMASKAAWQNKKNAEGEDLRHFKS
jgi:hypothetical protein